MIREAFPFKLTLKLGILHAKFSALPSSSGAFLNITEIPELMLGVCTQALLSGSDLLLRLGVGGTHWWCIPSLRPPLVLPLDRIC